VPVPRADLSPPCAANLVGDFLDALDLRNVIVVANDSDGAIAQLLMVQRPERIDRVVLTSSDSFERFFPPPFVFLPNVARVPGAVWLLVALLRVRALHGMQWSARSVKRPAPSTNWRT
jgi:pimeloyl-ACP methyl ester carboxylesterase